MLKRNLPIFLLVGSIFASQSIFAQETVDESPFQEGEGLTLQKKKAALVESSVDNLTFEKREKLREWQTVIRKFNNSSDLLSNDEKKWLDYYTDEVRKLGGDPYTILPYTKAEIDQEIVVLKNNIQTMEDNIATGKFKGQDSMFASFVPALIINKQKEITRLEKIRSELKD